MLEQTGRLFDDIWFDFVEQALFGSSALAGNPLHLLLVPKDVTQATTNLELGADYTVKVISIRVQACAADTGRKAAVSTTSPLAGSSQIRLRKVARDGTNAVYVDTLLSAGDSVTGIELDDQTMIVAAAFNNSGSAIALDLSASAEDCTGYPSFSGRFPVVELYNKDFIGDVSFTMTGDYLSVQQGAWPSIAFMALKGLKPAPGTTSYFSLQGDGSGASAVLAIDATNCRASATFSFRIVNHYAIPTPIRVSIDGCS